MPHLAPPADPNAPAAVKDPVCGMTVQPGTTPHHRKHRGSEYYFCGARCLGRFAANPEQFLRPTSPVEAPADDSAEYTCPMHPEVVQRGPGSCPICGMALEPRVISLDGEEANPELDDMTRRARVSAVLTAPLFLLAMSDLIPGAPIQHRLSPALLALGYQARSCVPVECTRVPHSPPAARRFATACA